MNARRVVRRFVRRQRFGYGHCDVVARCYPSAMCGTEYVHRGNTARYVGDELWWLCETAARRFDMHEVSICDGIIAMVGRS